MTLGLAQSQTHTHSDTQHTGHRCTQAHATVPHSFTHRDSDVQVCRDTQTHSDTRKAHEDSSQTHTQTHT